MRTSPRRWLQASDPVVTIGRVDSRPGAYPRAASCSGILVPEADQGWLRAGLLARPRPRAFPDILSSGLSRDPLYLVGLTAAGPPRVCTGFPFHAHAGDPKSSGSHARGRRGSWKNQVRQYVGQLPRFVQRCAISGAAR
jgi:hypothetical protein